MAVSDSRQEEVEVRAVLTARSGASDSVSVTGVL